MWRAIKYGALAGIAIVVLVVCALMMGCGKKPQSQPKPHTQAEPLANTTATYTCTGCTSAAGATVGNTFHLELSKTRHRRAKGIDTSINGAPGATYSSWSGLTWENGAAWRGPSIVISEDAKYFVIEISDSRGMLVGVLKDGTVEYGENYHPDDAARTFWQVLASQYSSVCNAANRNPEHGDVQP